MHKYAVALSFAGEDRVFAAAVAERLRACGVEVFYDEFEQHVLWGADLYETLQKVYVRECRYCVLVLSPPYMSRMWTTFERKQVIDRLAREHGSECVLPVRLNGFSGDVPGLSGGIGFLSVGDDQPKVVADTLMRKLGTPGYEVDSQTAYEIAVGAARRIRDGYLDIARLYTSVEHLSNAYQAFNGVADLLGFMGHSFYWQRESGGPLELFAKNDDLDHLKEKGLTTICKFAPPEMWIGCGLWQLLPPEPFDSENFSEDSELVIALYLYSDVPGDLQQLMDTDSKCVFLAGMCLKGSEVESFLKLARERYDSLA